MSAAPDPGDGIPPKPAWRVFLVIVATLVIAAVLNAQHLMRDAKQLPFGENRDRWVAVWQPFVEVNEFLRLEGPRDLLSDDPVEDLPDAAAPIPAAPDPGDPTEGPPPATPTAAAGVTQVPRSPTPTPTPTPSAVRTPTQDNPVKLYIGGDSLAEMLGQSLVRMSEASGLFDAEVDAHISTGLARPDYFNWPQRLFDAAKDGAEVIVFVVGSNDPQGIKDPAGKTYAPFSDGWKAEYARRVGATMDMLRAPGRLLIWVGQPVMRSDTLSHEVAEINNIFREQAASRDWVRYIDLWPVFADASGGYTAYLPDADGDVVQVRAPDGIHFTRDGGDRAAEAIMGEILAEVQQPSAMALD
ncbi:MAG: DUF459 domain-containing protein [Hyphomicrobiales bacterium]